MARRHWIDVAIAPLRWVERARGWRRTALLAAYALIAGTAGVLIGREAVLGRIPDLPDPVPPLAGPPRADRLDDPTMAEYRRAIERLAPDMQGGIQPWVEASRPALDIWLAASRRPIPPPIGAGSDEKMDVSRTHRFLFYDLSDLEFLAIQEARRWQEAGDPAGAWALYLGVLRTAIQVDRRSLQSHDQSWVAQTEPRWSPAVRGWADRPEASPATLRRALADLNDCLALRPTEADIVRDRYCLVRNTLNDPDHQKFWRENWLDNSQTYAHLPGIAAAVAFWQNEPKRSLRLLRVVTAGQVARAGLPRARRPSVVQPEAYGVYAIHPATPPALARLRPEVLLDWIQASYGRDAFRSWDPAQSAVLDGWDRVDQTRASVAARLFEIDHPDRQGATFGALVPGYLDALPPSIKPGDPL